MDSILLGQKKPILAVLGTGAGTVCMHFWSQQYKGTCLQYLDVRSATSSVANNLCLGAYINNL